MQIPETLVVLLYRYFSQHEDSLLTQLTNLIFWLLLADAFWRAATRDGETRGEVGGPRRRAAIAREISFDQVLLLAHTPRGYVVTLYKYLLPSCIFYYAGEI